MNPLVYCATPSRLVRADPGILARILDYVAERGGAPLHPFLAFPYGRFEGGPVGRARTLEYCARLVGISDEFWMFGVSEGTLREMVCARGHRKPVQLHFSGFDPQWEEFYGELGARYQRPLDDILLRQIG